MPESSDKSIPTLASELLDLVRAYAKQETIEPLKGIGRWLAFGVAGSVLLGTGLLLLAVGALRALQTETGEAFDGDLTWVPYLIVVAGSGLVTVVALRAIGRHKRKGKGR